MLVLSRKPSEAIMIGENGEMKVTVLAVNGYQVKIGIEAPRAITVHREEVFLKIQNLLQTKLNEEGEFENVKAANDDRLK